MYELALCAEASLLWAVSYGNGTQAENGAETYIRYIDILHLRRWTYLVVQLVLANLVA